MSLALPVELQSLLDSGHALIRNPEFWWAVGALLLATAGALLVRRALSQGLVDRSEQSGEYSIRYMALKTLQRILFPISMLLGVLAGRALLLHLGKPVELLNLAVPLLTSLTIIRIVVYFLRKTFRPGPAMKAWESIIVASIWIVVALHLLDWLPCAAGSRWCGDEDGR